MPVKIWMTFDYLGSFINEHIMLATTCGSKCDRFEVKGKAVKLQNFDLQNKGQGRCAIWLNYDRKWHP